MSNNQPQHVNLEVKASRDNRNGWMPIQGSNGQTYSYRYTGGNTAADNGNAEFGVKRGATHVDVELDTKTRDRFEFARRAVKFCGDSKQQLQVQGNSKHRRRILDQCTLKINVKYTVTVVDTQAGNATFPCDPYISNT